MAIRDYLIMSGCVQLNSDPEDLTGDEAQEAVGKAMGSLFQGIGNTESSGQGIGPHPAGTPWELVSHNVFLIGRQLVATGVLRFQPTRAERRRS